MIAVVNVAGNAVCAVIVPVAGVVGVPVTVYVKVVAAVTVIVKVPLYAAWLAPAIVTCCPVVNPCGLAVVTVTAGNCTVSDACGGAGLIATERCSTCGGAGVESRSDVVGVPVPPGVESGARISLSGAGHAGRGAEPAGDLYVTVSVASHPHFRRAGRDLHLVLPVAIHEAVLGARVDVPTLDGPVRLRVPPGTPSGQRLRLRGRGVPPVPGIAAEAGDLIVEVQVVLPPIRDERSRELLREFGRLNDVDVRAGLFGGTP